MDLLRRIKTDRMDARKVKGDKADKLRIKLLTTLVGEAETALKGKQAAKFDMLTLVKKFYSNAEESLAHMYTEEVHTELCILNEYIPDQLTEEYITDIITFELPTTCDIGYFMGYMNRRYKGRFDGKLASKVFKAMMMMKGG